MKTGLLQHLTLPVESSGTSVLFLSAEFEDAMKKREHEFRVQVDEMNAKVLEYDLKVSWL